MKLFQFYAYRARDVGYCGKWKCTCYSIYVQLNSEVHVSFFVFVHVVVSGFIIYCRQHCSLLLAVVSGSVEGVLYHANALSLGLRSQEMRRAFVSTRVLVQVLLVVCFGVVPSLDVLDGGGDLVVRVPLFLEVVSHLLCRLVVLGAVCHDSRSVLGSHIWALGVHCGWIVDSEEDVQEVA